MVRLGFIGTGDRAIGEMLELAAMEGVSLAAFCDVDAQRCERALAQVNAAADKAGRPAVALPFFTDPKAMLAAVDLDAVYVSVPPFAHGAAEHAVLDAGRALFVEKPVANNITVAREIAAHVAEAGVVNAVGYQLRYYAGIRRAKELLAGRTVGMAMATRFGGVPGAPWWRVQAQSGGMLVEMHTHGVDLLRFLVGDVASVYAAAGTRLLTEMPGLDIADVNAVTLRFANGAVGVIANSCALTDGLRLPGADGLYILAKGLGLSIRGVSGTASFEGGANEALPSGEDGNVAMNAAFVRALATGDRSGILSDYAEGLATFELTWACHLSATRGQEIRLGEGY